jgi:hypothetical protein
MPTVFRREQVSLAYGVNITEITRRSSFNQGHHLACHNVGKTIQLDVDPGEIL